MEEDMPTQDKKNPNKNNKEKHKLFQESLHSGFFSQFWDMTLYNNSCDDPLSTMYFFRLTDTCF